MAEAARIPLKSLGGEVNILGVTFKEKLIRNKISGEEKAKIRELGKEYWDDENYPGYQGFYYDGRWKSPMENLIRYYELSYGDKVLDAGCGKGFMMYEIFKINPLIGMYGADLSRYAIERAKEEVKNNIVECNITRLPFPDNYFSLAYSIAVLYALSLGDCIKAIKEIKRVSINSFVQVHTYRNEKEKRNLIEHDATAETIMSIDEWKSFFREIGYDRHYYWTVFL